MTQLSTESTIASNTGTRPPVPSLNLQNPSLISVFVPIAKCICLNWKLYFPKLQIVFAQIKNVQLLPTHPPVVSIYYKIHH